MRPEMRDRVLAAADEAMKSLGMSSLEQGVDFVCVILEKLLEWLNQMRTREQAIATLDQLPDFPPEEEPLAAAAFRMLPSFVGMGIRELWSQARRELPGPPKGRKRVLSTEEQATICRFIGDLNTTKGVDKQLCKKRAAQQFGVGLRTVERAWKNRAVVFEQVPEPDFEAVMKWTRKLFLE